MFPTAAPPRTRIAGLAARARNIVDSGLCTRTSAVPDYFVRLEEYERLAAAPADARRATLQVLDDDIVVDLLVLTYLRCGTPYALWADTLAGFAEDILGTTTWAEFHQVLNAT
ncbi:hypothetical protein ACIP93_33715 [Streptomyces sp. NPDC088745]|uniref:hypothetical protein n=1 Tax=Streptomyces sp. NPDC088745 TaxID=3365884 RepID=UPI0038017A0F